MLFSLLYMSAAEVCGASGYYSSGIRKKRKGYSVEKSERTAATTSSLEGIASFSNSRAKGIGLSFPHKRIGDTFKEAKLSGSLVTWETTSAP
jgi:hypothetical protein